MKPARDAPASCALPCFAPGQPGAWIETLICVTFYSYNPASPLGNRGRGLKPEETIHQNISLLASPLGNRGRGLKRLKKSRGRDC